MNDPNLKESLSISDFIFKRNDIEESGTYEVNVNDVIGWWRDGIIDADTKVVPKTGRLKGKAYKISIFPDLVKYLDKEAKRSVLADCPKCYKTISKRAPLCPHCKTSLIQQCNICRQTISVYSKTCPECGDPDPFNALVLGEVLVCPHCGEENNIELQHCDVCHEHLVAKKQVIDPETGNPIKSEDFIKKCINCGHQMSFRAKKCPQCGAIPEAECQICKSIISTLANSCPNCGDPEPFTGELVKEHKTNDQTALTSYYSKQESEHYVTATNTRPSNFSLSWFLFSFDGRIGRQAFWCAYPVIFLFGVTLSVAIELVKESGTVNGLIIIVILTLLLLWPSLAIQVKRWHDRNKSGNWIILNMIPLIGFLWITIELGFLKGTQGNNDYGNDPLSS